MQATELFRSCHSFAGALDTLLDEATRLGFDAIDYGYLPRARRPDGGWHAPHIVSRRFPPRWERGWERFASADPYLCSCYQRNLPLDWNEVKSASWLSTTQRKAIAFIDTLGFLDGITVPIHLADGRFAFVSGLSNAPLGAWRVQSRNAEQLFVLAHAFHAAVAEDIAHNAPPPAILTAREREVLMHAAAGHSAPATAERMCRALETIRRQRKAAMAKLGASTITQAVARAMALRLI